MQDSERLKREAARRALELVRPGMKLGLGTGSTARHFVDLLGEGSKPACRSSACRLPRRPPRRRARSAIPLATLDEYPELDLTIDGADEVDAALRLIKGGGGALLREKIVAAASKRMVVIADASKYVARLGSLSACPSKSSRSAWRRRAAISSASAPTSAAARTIVLRPQARGRRRFRHRRRPLYSRLRLRRDRRARSARRGAARAFPGSSIMVCSSALRAPSFSPARTASRRSATSPDHFRRSTGDSARDRVICPRSRPPSPRRFSDRGMRVSAYADDPTPAALESARTIIVASGLDALLRRRRSASISANWSEASPTTRPELKDSLHATLMALDPEFVKTEQDLINNAAMVARQTYERSRNSRTPRISS